MKIICLLGSPRPKGNSAAMASKFCETAKGLGAEVTTFALNKLKYRGCQACMTCKTKLENSLKKNFSFFFTLIEVACFPSLKP